jgi:hypothetical protein
MMMIAPDPRISPMFEKIVSLTSYQDQLNSFTKADLGFVDLNRKTINESKMTKLQILTDKTPNCRYSFVRFNHLENSHIGKVISIKCVPNLTENPIFLLDEPDLICQMHLQLMKEKTFSATQKKTIYRNLPHQTLFLLMCDTEEFEIINISNVTGACYHSPEGSNYWIAMPCVSHILSPGAGPSEIC